MTEKVTVIIGDSAKAEVWRDREWTILYVEDGGGGKTTISLDPSNAFDLSQLLHGSAITASTKLSGRRGEPAPADRKE